MSLKKSFYFGIIVLSFFSTTFLSIPQLSAQVTDEQRDLNRLERLGTPFLGSDGISAALAEGNLFYVIGNQTGLQTFFSEDPFGQGIEPAGESIVLGLSTIGIAKKGKYLYVSDNVNGINVVDVGDSSKPRLVGMFPTSSNQSEDLVLDETGNYLFVATGKGGVEVWDVSKSEKPKRVFETARLLTWSYAWSVTYNEKKLIVADREGGVRVFDASKPTALKLLYSYKGTGDTRSAILKDNTLYLANGAAGFEVVDVKNPARPNRIFSEAFLPNYVSSVSFYKRNPNYIFVAAGRSGIVVYDTRLFVTAPRRAKEKADKGVGEITRFVQNGQVLYSETLDKGVSMYYFNLAPKLENVVDLTTDENKELTYTFKGLDPDENKFKIELIPEGGKMPDSLFYSVQNSTLRWKPSFEQSGVYNFTVKLTELLPDSLFGSSLQKPIVPVSVSKRMKITVKHVNRAPSLLAIADQVLTEGKPFTFTLTAGSDPDKEDEGKLTYSVSGNPSGTSFDPKTRTLTWTPASNQSGEHRIKFIVTDSNSDKLGAKTDEKELRVRVENVNLAPKLVRMERQILFENKPQTIKIEVIDPDREDSAKHVFKALALPKGSTFDPSSRLLSWTPTYEQAGEYTARFQVNDQGLDAKLVPNPKQALTDTMTIFISVKQTNRSPILAAIGAKPVKENSALSFAISATDPDREDAGKLAFSTDSLPQGAAFDPARRIFQWTPTFEQSGDYTVRFKVMDVGIDGTPLMATEDVKITVSNVNRVPSLDPIAEASGIEGTALSFKVTAKDPDREDVGKLKITTSPLPAGATFDGENFAWTPNFDQNGTYKITYTVTDAEGLKDTKIQSIFIAHLNREPNFAQVSPQIGQETAKVTFAVEANDQDKEDAGKLTYKALNLPLGAAFDPLKRIFSWVPTFDQAGEYKVIFVVSDRGLDSKLLPSSNSVLHDSLEVAITVKQLNRAPILAAIGPKKTVEGGELTFKVSASDPDKEDEGKLTVTATGLPEGATFDEKTLVFVWKPDFTQNGTFSVSFSVNDSGNDDKLLTDTETITITVDHINRAPKFSPIDAVTSAENSAISVSPTATDSDLEDEGKLKFTAKSLPQGASFDGSKFSWTPSFEQAGSYRILFTVEDQGLNEVLKPTGAKVLRDTASLIITVSQTNRKPTLNLPVLKAAKENQPYTFAVSGTDPDREDAGKLIYSADNLPIGAQFNSETRTFSWTPTYDQSGSYKVIFSVKDAGIDGTPLSESKTAEFTVENVNRPPVLQPVSEARGREADELMVEFMVSDPDKEDEGKLKVSVSPLTTGASLDGSILKWKPSFDQSGSYKATVTVTDAAGAKDSKPVTITIENVNQSPKLDPISNVSAKEKEKISFKITAKDSDKEDVPAKGADRLSFSADGLPKGATFDAARRSFNWTPSVGQAGEYSVTFRVKDKSGAEDQTTVKISVVAAAK
ncbi:MAG: putative Ig domain-containing protein [Chloroherpetonaceae bacterium]|nr:putative Ig domain-containing protein [Chloroherpetonaceae bacterium]